MLGSAQVLSEDLGSSSSPPQVVVRSGPSLPGAAKLILVVGSQKIVPDLDSALRRNTDYVMPYENARLRQQVGMGTKLARDPDSRARLQPRSDDRDPGARAGRRVTSSRRSPGVSGSVSTRSSTTSSTSIAKSRPAAAPMRPPTPCGTVWVDGRLVQGFRYRNIHGSGEVAGTPPATC
jgi:hypothetical protein